jgi:hypothetical protein
LIHLGGAANRIDYTPRPAFKSSGSFFCGFNEVLWHFCTATHTWQLDACIQGCPGNIRTRPDSDSCTPPRCLRGQRSERRTSTGLPAGKVSIRDRFSSDRASPLPIVTQRCGAGIGLRARSEFTIKFRYQAPARGNEQLRASRVRQRRILRQRRSVDNNLGRLDATFTPKSSNFQPQATSTQGYAIRAGSRLRYAA